MSVRRLLPETGRNDMGGDAAPGLEAAADERGVERGLVARCAAGRSWCVVCAAPALHRLLRDVTR